MRQITAYSNPLVKSVRDLRDKRHRREQGRFLAEGLRILTEAREAGRLPVMVFFAAASAGERIGVSMAVPHTSPSPCTPWPSPIDSRAPSWNTGRNSVEPAVR